jgi:predicted nucleotidyltransferase component of viral defense system
MDGTRKHMNLPKRPLRNRLELARSKLKVNWTILEQDYLLSYILVGITQVPILQNTLIFKGGTALKKCYFGDYRFSEDLDFSTLNNAPRGVDLLHYIEEACMKAEALLGEHTPVEIVCERYIEKDPHPDGQEAFTVKARFPWHRQPQTRVMIEITMQEIVHRSPILRPILHEYGDELSASLYVYTLEEIMAEKLRALLQHTKKLHERGWGRSRARDYYDLWRIFNQYEKDLDLSEFTQLVHSKCSAKNVSYNNVGDFFQDIMLANVTNTWEQWLGPLVPNLPSLSEVIADLRGKLEQVLL